jgi:hypothetical protein
MRLLVTLILIALLPLRSWAGDVMAVRMAEQAAHHAVAVPVALPESVQAHVNCHEVGEPAAMVVQHEATQDSSPDGGCDTCVSCQVCSSVAVLEPLSAQKRVGTYPFAVPLQAASIFASAELAPGQKPPIS